MQIRPDITISTLRREINFLTEINDGSLKIGELHVNRANYRDFDANNSNPVKRLLARMWMNNLLGHLKRLDKMVVLTDNALLDWPELDNVVKIPDALPFKIDSKSELSAKRVLSIGRYAYDKGNDLLLQAWSIIEKQNPDWTLDIYGNGNREPYQKQMVEFGVDQQRCHLFGPVADVKKEYLSCSVFVLPSRFEGFGLVIIEAMACGVPVVAFDCENGPRSIITDGENGFLIPPFDISLFAEKVMLLMKDHELRFRMGTNAQKTASQYEIDRIGQQWKRLFDELKQQ
jgi:glycosyltransferase involved in cell wall biosynthesis